jgi:hypothetical protein
MTEDRLKGERIMSINERPSHTKIIAVLVILTLFLLSFSIVVADSDIPYPTSIVLPAHYQNPFPYSPLAGVKANNYDSIPIPMLIPTPLPTPLSQDNPTNVHISFLIPQFSHFPSFIQYILNNGVYRPGNLSNTGPFSEQTTSPTNEGLSVFKRYDTLHYLNVTNLL